MLVILILIGLVIYNLILVRKADTGERNERLEKVLNYVL